MVDKPLLIWSDYNDSIALQDFIRSGCAYRCNNDATGTSANFLALSLNQFTSKWMKLTFAY